MPIIPAQPDEILITLHYSADGVDMWDNHIIGWYFGNQANPNDAWPCIVSLIPEDIASRGQARRAYPKGADPQAKPPIGGGGGDSVFSPAWIAVFKEKAVASNGIWTGSPREVFDFLATNNGANRKLKSNFVYPLTAGAWAQWSAQNPTLVWKE